MRALALAVALVAPGVLAANPNDAPADPTTGKKGDTIGQVMDPSTGKWVPMGSTGAPYTGDIPSFRKNAIWNSIQFTGLRHSPTGTAPVSEYGGALAYDVFTVPERSETVDLVAHLHVGGGYTAQQNKLLDVVLGLGAGYSVGPFALTVLAALDYDGVWGDNASTLQVPAGLLAGPEARLQLWALQWASLEVYAARLFSLTASLPDGSDRPAETRVGGALSLIGGGHGAGVSLGLAYSDYGVGSALTATVALRWGAR